VNALFVCVSGIDQESSGEDDVSSISSEESNALASPVPEDTRCKFGVSLKLPSVIL